MYFPVGPLLDIRNSGHLFLKTPVQELIIGMKVVGRQGKETRSRCFCKHTEQRVFAQRRLFAAVEIAFGYIPRKCIDVINKSFGFRITGNIPFINLFLSRCNLFLYRFFSQKMYFSVFKHYTSYVKVYTFLL